ncbi:choice-of-anchor V domain-containing protein [uncultured Polaribacter sp.]|uniref:choice-of-anchor V domain-containing protein n=1 Tax=uncultured Polaribacter sp. TaxID=174711 RepID=UPI0026299CDB|nr:choice-of-anchor V domain-containing protein [uncultured Polaribacter sp.]
MKKNYLFKFLLLAIPVTALLLMSNSGGITAGRSGSPGDGGNSCAGCHTGGSVGVSANITTNIPAGGYELNTNYTVSVNATSSAAGGFQMVAENASNTKVGAFTAGTGSRTTTDKLRITHSNSDNNSWSFTWKSPATDAGNIKFYAAAVVANGDGNNGAGDKVALTSTSGATVLGISEAKRLNFDMFPNPSSENVTIQLPSGANTAVVDFYDYVGRLALSKKITTLNNKIEVANLSAGVYLLKVVTDDKIGSQQFIKN